MTFPIDPIPILNQELQRLNCGGALLAISENGQITICSAGTLAGTDHDRPFYIYSISKTLTAAAILRLSEEGKLHLDAPLTTYLKTHPSIPDVTVRQLLNHTSGLSDYFSAPDYQKAVFASPSHPWSAEKLMEVGLRDTPLFEAGSKWAYSNPGYTLLKQLIESLSGQDYHSYILDDLLRELSLKHTRPFLTIDHGLEMLPGEAPEMAGDFRNQYNPDWIAPGCFISTVGELAMIFDALFDERLITRRSLDEMTKTVDVLPASPDGPSPSYGLGIMHERNSPLGDAFGHGGGGPGYTTYALHYPDLAGNKVSIATDCDELTFFAQDGDLSSRSAKVRIGKALRQFRGRHLEGIQLHIEDNTKSERQRVMFTRPSSPDPVDLDHLFRGEVGDIGEVHTLQKVSEASEEKSEWCDNLETCPEEYLLWFHRVPWDHEMKSGRTLWEELARHYQRGVDWVEAAREKWSGLKGKIDPEIHAEVARRLAIQERDATRWRDACLLYFGTFSKRPLPDGVGKPSQSLEAFRRQDPLDLEGP